MNRRAQVAIWTVFALAVILIILVIFLLANKQRGGEQEINYSPDAFIRKCVGDSAYKFADEILPKGGFVSPIGYIKFNNASIVYLCRNEGYFKTCVNQHPALINEIVREIEEKTKDEVEECFSQLKDNLDERNIDSTIGKMEYKIELAPRRIIATINRDVEIKEKESSQFINNWKIEINHPIYNLANVAIEIANQESTYCYFEYAGFMMLYPDFVIEKKALTEGSKIYTVRDVKSEKEMNFAVRGCVIPPGM